MKKIAKIFVCDDCGKEAKPMLMGFPYDKGWIYLHSLNAKFDKDDYVNIKDKHFNGKSCMMNYIDKKLVRKAGK